MKFVLKKVLRKLYHLISFLTLMIIFIPNVKANEAVSNIAPNGQKGQWQIPLAAQCFNSSFNSVNTSWNNNYLDVGGVDGKDYYNCNFGSDGLISITTNQLTDSNKLYSLVLYIGNSSGTSPNAPSKIGLGTSTYTARNDIVYSRGNGTMWSSRVSNMLDMQQPASGQLATLHYYAVYVVFSSNSSSTSVAIRLTYPSSVTTWIFGYELNYIGNTNNLTKNDVESALSNSGFATASSVQQVQQSVTQVQQEVSDVNDTLNDSKVDSSDSTINNLKDKIPTNSVISDLLLLPVRFLQNFVNALGSSCSRFSLGSLYGTELFMPCINIENYLGSGIWTTIDLIISGLFVYSLRKKFIEIYENLTNLKNGGNEVD